MIEFLFFIAATVLLSIISRNSLRRPRSHGFYRFFSWEAILALLCLNIGLWFHDPFSFHQWISWSLLTVSLILVVSGTKLLRAHGGHSRGRDDGSLFAFEKTATLVTSGIFRHIRHPLYSSLLFLAWGIFFKEPSWEGGTMVCAATFFLAQTAKADEAECIRYFGPEYEAYMKKSKMFLPYLF